MKVDDIAETIYEYLKKNNPEDRFTSFDYCYNYFQTNRGDKLDVEKGCFALGFYLASWGMYRGSSFLLEKSVKHYQKTIEFIQKSPKEYWNIDVSNYGVDNLEVLLGLYSKIKELLIPSSQRDVTLITKLLLGVFGCVPAFDTYFTKTFKGIYTGCGFAVVNKESLNHIKDFYESYKEIIDNFGNIKTKCLITGENTQLNYPLAKIIDMYGFQKSQP